MTVPANSIDVSATGVRIASVLISELTIGEFSAVLGRPRVVRTDIFEPDDRGILPSTLQIWDADGIWAYTVDGTTIEQILSPPCRRCTVGRERVLRRRAVASSVGVRWPMHRCGPTFGRRHSSFRPGGRPRRLS